MATRPSQLACRAIGQLRDLKLPVPQTSERPVVIVGAGLAGLSCAHHLNAAGVGCVILEAGDDVGGRVRTDKVDGFLLDRGFQVFNDAYPDARDLLDYEALDLKRFDPGALTMVNGREGFAELVDPFRRPGRAFATATSPAATIGDKWRIATLSKKVLAGEADDLFDSPEQTTLDFLHGRGFSDRIIESFFRPFFGGVFLDRSLGSSARLFTWLYRMFARGSAFVPAAGMGAIPRQIYRRLSKTEVRLNAPAALAEPGAIRLCDGTRVGGRAIVVATDAPAAVAILGERAPTETRDLCARESITLYFAALARPTDRNLILLSGQQFAETNGVNSVAVLTNVAPSYSLDGGILLSVSMLDVEGVLGDDAELIEMALSGLRVMFGAELVRGLRHLKTYRIGWSLPDQTPPMMDEAHKPVDLGQGIYLCGDHRDTASINGAILSGRRTAEAILVSGKETPRRS